VSTVLSKNGGAIMPALKLKRFLEAQKVPYHTIHHSSVATTQQLAASMHVRGWEVAKATILRADGRYVMAVLPAPCQVDLERLRAAVRAESLAVVPESEIRALFPDCEAGAMPPFGNLYGMPVYLDERLVEDDSIVFNAGTHTEALRMAFGDYEKCVHPAHARFGVLPGTAG
jgi:Ala-tRNA(Pro) deacylase